MRVRRVGRGVLLEPLVADPDAWFAELDRHGGADEPFMAAGRDQPATPVRGDLFPPSPSS